MPGHETTIDRDELMSLLERVADASGMGPSSASSWLSGVRRVLDATGEGEHGATVDLSDEGLRRQERALERTRLTPKTRDNYWSSWKRARELALELMQAREAAREDAFWERLERRARRRIARRSSASAAPRFDSVPSIAPAMANETSPTEARELRTHIVTVSGVGDLIVQLPDHMTTREASALIQFILDQVGGGSEA